MPEDRLLIQYQEGDEVLLQLDDSASGMADVPLAVGYQVKATDRSALSAWLTVDVPVGDSDAESRRAVVPRTSR